MTLLKRSRHAILPALALAAWGVTAWAASDGVDRDDVIPAAFAAALTVIAFLDYRLRRFWRDHRQAHADRDLGVLAEGVAAYMREVPGGDGQRAPGPRKGS